MLPFTDIPIDDTLIVTCIIVGLLAFVAGVFVRGFKTEPGDTYVFETPRDAWEHGKSESKIHN